MWVRSSLFFLSCLMVDFCFFRPKVWLTHLQNGGSDTYLSQHCMKIRNDTCKATWCGEFLVMLSKCWMNKGMNTITGTSQEALSQELLSQVSFRSRGNTVAHLDFLPLAWAVKRDAKSVSWDGWGDGVLATRSHRKAQRMLRATRSIIREEL